MSLRKFSWRSLRQRPGRTILTVLSIIIGVATTVSFAVVTASTRDAYRNMFSLVTGRTSLEISAPGDIQILNNYVTLHSRTEFVDADDPKLKRHLLRLWLQFPEGRSYMRKYPTIYDGIPHTIRRG